MKFCKKCGKQLADGQICDCTSTVTIPTSVPSNPQPAPYRAAPPIAQPRPAAPTASPQQAQPNTQSYRASPPAQPRQAPQVSSSHTQQAQPKTTHQSTSSSASRSKIGTTSPRYVELFMNKIGLGSLYNKMTSYYEREKMIVPDCIAPNEGEIPVKQYNIAVLRTLSRFERSEGRLQVTNKRIVFRATGRSISGSTAFQQEFAIDELAGIEALRNYRFRFIYFLADLVILSLMLLVILAVCACLALPMIIPNSIINSIYAKADQNTPIKFDLAVRDYYELPLETQNQRDFPTYDSFKPNKTIYSAFRVLFIVIGLAISIFIVIRLLKWRNKALLKHVKVFLLRFLLRLIRIARRPNLVLMIKTKGGMYEAAPIKIQRDRSFLFISIGVESGYDEVMPTNETDVAIKEIGAIITDIQKLGDHGVQKWKV